MHTIAISCGTHVIIFSDGNFRLEKSRKRKPPSLSLSRLVFFFPFLINATNLLLQTLLLLLLVFKLSSTCRYLPAIAEMTYVYCAATLSPYYVCWAAVFAARPFFYFNDVFFFYGQNKAKKKKANTHRMGVCKKKLIGYVKSSPV